MEIPVQLQICDEYSKLLLDIPKITIQGNAPDGIPQDKWIQIVSQLRADKYLSVSETNRDVCYLTSEARMFIKNGGYKTWFEEWDKNKKLQNSQAISVIITNKAVLVSLIVTGVAIIISCIFQVRSWSVSNEQLSISKSQYILDSLKHQSDSLSIDGLKLKMISIQKSLDELQKSKTASGSPITPNK